NICIIMSSHNTFNRKRALVHEYSKIFQCKYCPRTFSRDGTFLNQLPTLSDAMSLDENEEENPSEQRITVINNDIISFWNINDESTSISTIIDVKSVQKFKHANNSPPSYPNLAYEAFVQLLVKHHLSDSVANDIIGLFNNFHMDPTATLPSNAKAARKLLDSM